MNTELVQTDITTLSLDAKHDAVATAMMTLAALKECVREIEKQRDAFLLEWIPIHGEIEVGERRWYVGDETKIKCRDVTKAGKCLAELAGMSTSQIDAFLCLLASDALKHGAVRKFLKEKGVEAMFEELFEVTIVTNVHTGKPNKKVIEINDRFIR